MMTKFICVLIVILWSVSCDRQHSQPPLAAAGPATPAAETPIPPAQPPQPSSASSAPPGAPGSPDGAGALVTGHIDPLPGPSVQPAPRVTIPAGSRVRVRLAQSLSSKYSRAGERFAAYLDDPIVSGDRVIVPKGTVFHGRVTEAKSSGRLRGRAYLGLMLVSFRLHGVTYRIVTTADLRRSGSHKRRDLALVGGGSGAGAAVGAVAGGGVGALIGAGAGAVAGTSSAFITGKKHVKLPAETRLVFSLREPVSLPG